MKLDIGIYEKYPTLQWSSMYLVGDGLKTQWQLKEVLEVIEIYDVKTIEGIQFPIILDRHPCTYTIEQGKVVIEPPIPYNLMVQVDYWQKPK